MPLHTTPPVSRGRKTARASAQATLTGVTKGVGFIHAVGRQHHDPGLLQGADDVPHFAAGQRVQPESRSSRMHTTNGDEGDVSSAHAHTRTQNGDVPRRGFIEENDVLSPSQAQAPSATTTHANHATHSYAAKMRTGSPTHARATDKRRRMPPLKVVTAEPLTSSRPTASKRGAVCWMI